MPIHSHPEFLHAALTQMAVQIHGHRIEEPKGDKTGNEGTNNIDKKHEPENHGAAHHLQTAPFESLPQRIDYEHTGARFDGKERKGAANGLS